MNELAPLFDQVRSFLSQNLPQETMTRTVPLLLGVLLVGAALSVLGAKLARPVVAAAFAGLGAFFGIQFARAGGFSAPLCAALTAAMFATVAHLTFRLWAGVLTGGVIAVLALGAYGYQNVAPHAAEFSAISPAPSTEMVELSPEPAETLVGATDTAKAWMRDFWNFVRQRDASVETEGRLIAAAAGLAGLFLGVIAVRTMLVLSTSVLGTLLVVSAVGAFFAKLWPSSYQAMTQSPIIMGIGVGGFFLTSLIAQALLTRRSTVAKAE